MHIVIKALKMMLLITAAASFLGSSCNKDGSKPCRNAPYSFAVTCIFKPEKEIYNIGDTILLISTFPKMLMNSISGQQINYSNNLGIGGNIGIGLIDSANHKFENGTDSFNLVSVTGTISIDSKKVINILYQETSTMFIFEVKIIAKKKGNYVLGVSDLSSQGIKNIDCTNAAFSMFINNSNKHFDILTNANIPGVSVDAQRIATNYCFRVN